MVDMYIVRVAPLVALLLLLSGCMGGSDDNTTSQESGGAGAAAAEETVETTQAAGQAQAPTTLKASGGLTDRLTDLASAMTSGVGYKCTYTYDGVASESWVKGQKFFSTSTVDGVASNMVSDGTWMYTWAEGETEGVKFNIADMKGAGSAQNSGYADLNQVANSAVNVDCRPDVSADSRFRPPSSVQFQDMGELMKQLQNMGPRG